MSQVSGKLSSRVMNMKFMKFSNDDESSDSTSKASSAGPDNIKKHEFFDNSEWSLTKNDDSKEKSRKNIKVRTVKRRVKTSTNRQPVISQNIGITTLKKQAVITAGVRGRKVFGSKVDSDGKRSINDEGNDNDQGNIEQNQTDEDKDGYDLDTIFKQSMRKRPKHSKK